VGVDAEEDLGFSAAPPGHRADFVFDLAAPPGPGIPSMSDPPERLLSFVEQR